MLLGSKKKKRILLLLPEFNYSGGKKTKRLYEQPYILARRLCDEYRRIISFSKAVDFKHLKLISN